MPKVCSFARVRNRLAREDGQGLVEFALVLPLILLVLLGLVDFGQAFNTQNDQEHLANVAIRYADVDACAQCNAADGMDRIVKYVWSQADSQELQHNGLTVCFFSPPGAPNPNNPVLGDPVEVKIRSTYHWLHYLGISPGTSSIVATATGRLEHDYDQAAYKLGDTYDGTTVTYSGNASTCS